VHRSLLPFLTSCAGALWLDLTGRAYILDEKAQLPDLRFVWRNAGAVQRKIPKIFDHLRPGGLIIPNHLEIAPRPKSDDATGLRRARINGVSVTLVAAACARLCGQGSSRRSDLDLVLYDSSDRDDSSDRGPVCGAARLVRD
jgi:hypothetical protein